MRVLPLFLLSALLLLPSASAYQQSRLIFDLDDSWSVVEQRHAAQTFEKEGMFLEIRSSLGEVPLLPPERFAAERGGKVVSQGEYGDLKVQEAVVTDSELVYILSHLAQGDEVYTLPFIAPEAQIGQGRLEMQKLYRSLEISPAQKFADAPWEEPLIYPAEEEEFSIPLGERVPIRKLVLGLIGVLIVVGLWKGRKRKPSKDS
jgi:hypothetical protein